MGIFGEMSGVHFANISDMKTLSSLLEPAVTCHQMKDMCNVATKIKTPDFLPHLQDFY